MLRRVTSKISHNPTLTALRGTDQDLRLLQNLISAEKTVLLTLQKLSVDYARASEALRAWSLGEGDDLGGILTASTLLLNHFSSALSQYAEHGHSIRRQLKTIRTRTESLHNLKRDQRHAQRKAEDADKHLRSLDPNNIVFAAQAEARNSLWKEVCEMNLEIKAEEAALGDFKRTATKIWMGLKFGGLVECCEKGAIAGKFGKLIIAEIPEGITQLGLARNVSYRRDEVEGCVADAHRGVHAVMLSTVPFAEFRTRDQYIQRSSESNTGPSYPPVFHIAPQPGPFNNGPMLLSQPQLPPTSNSEPTLSSQPQLPPTSNNGPTLSSQPQLPPTSNNGPPIQGESQPPLISTLDADNANYLQAIQNGISSSSGNQPPVSTRSLVDPEVVETSLSQTLPPSQQHGVDNVAHSPDPVAGSNTTRIQDPTPQWRAPGTFGQSKPDPTSIRARYPLRQPPPPPAKPNTKKPKGWFSRLFKL